MINKFMNKQDGSGVGKVFTTFITMWLVVLVISLTLSAGLIYAAIHFISKYW